MPTNLEQIDTILANTLAAIAEITASPKPSYNIDGQNVLWSEYLAQLQSTVSWCHTQLQALGEPWEVATNVVP